MFAQWLEIGSRRSQNCQTTEQMQTISIIYWIYFDACSRIGKIVLVAWRSFDGEMKMQTNRLNERNRFRRSALVIVGACRVSQHRYSSLIKKKKKKKLVANRHCSPSSVDDMLWWQATNSQSFTAPRAQYFAVSAASAPPKIYFMFENN